MKKPTFSKTNLDWTVDYDYDRSPCRCHDWPCRCTTIERTWIEKVDVKEVVDTLFHNHCKNETNIDKYCFDRICHAFNVYDKELYEVRTGSGYYGEEVYGVYFDNEEKIVNAYSELQALKTDIEKVKYCLKLEYGYLIDCVKSATSAAIIEVSLDNIRIPQTDYFIKVDKDVIEDYKDRNLPIAACIKSGDCYRLIDGYHRYVANKERDSVDIIVLE